MKLVLLLAQMLDTVCAWWIFTSGFYCLWQGQIYEASALIIAGVFWQRGWKAELIKAVKESQIKAREASND